MKLKASKKLLVSVAVLVAVTLAGSLYIQTNPLLFNESFWSHAHCIKAATFGFHQYADEHDGAFPTHPNGYGNALLLLDEQYDYCMTGPGYDPAAFREAQASGGELPEEACGRVYVQGLTTRSNSEIVLLFDKVPTPGGDHCHFPQRLWAVLGREVLFVNGETRFIDERDWPDFAAKQVNLLVQEGIRREDAERLYILLQ